MQHLQTDRFCRTCLHSIPRDALFFQLDGQDPSSVALLIKSQLQACVPEVSVGIVKNPVLCNPCLNNLTSAYKFKSKCLQTEKQILDYVLHANPDIAYVDLSLVVKRIASNSSSVSQKWKNDVRPQSPSFLTHGFSRQKCLSEEECKKNDDCATDMHDVENSTAVEKSFTSDDRGNFSDCKDNIANLMSSDVKVVGAYSELISIDDISNSVINGIKKDSQLSQFTFKTILGECIDILDDSDFEENQVSETPLPNNHNDNDVSLPAVPSMNNKIGNNVESSGPSAEDHGEIVEGFGKISTKNKNGKNMESSRKITEDHGEVVEGFGKISANSKNGKNMECSSKTTEDHGKIAEGFGKISTNNKNGKNMESSSKIAEDHGKIVEGFGKISTNNKNGKNMEYSSKTTEDHGKIVEGFGKISANNKNGKNMESSSKTTEDHGKIVEGFGKISTNHKNLNKIDISTKATTASVKNTDISLIKTSENDKNINTNQTSRRSHFKRRKKPKKYTKTCSPKQNHNEITDNLTNLQKIPPSFVCANETNVLVVKTTINNKNIATAHSVESSGSTIKDKKIQDSKNIARTHLVESSGLTVTHKKIQDLPRVVLPSDNYLVNEPKECVKDGTNVDHSNVTKNVPFIMSNTSVLSEEVVSSKAASAEMVPVVDIKEESEMVESSTEDECRIIKVKDEIIIKDECEFQQHKSKVQEFDVNYPNEDLEDDPDFMQNTMEMDQLQSQSVEADASLAAFKPVLSRTFDDAFDGGSSYKSVAKRGCYSCAVCSYSCNSEFILVAHTKIHANKNSYTYDDKLMFRGFSRAKFECVGCKYAQSVTWLTWLKPQVVLTQWKP